MGMKPRIKDDAEDKVLRIRGMLKAEYHAALQGYNATEGQLRAAKAELQLLQADPAHAEVFEAVNRVTEAKRAHELSASEAREVAERVSKKLGLSMEEFKRYAVNTTTGAVKLVD